MATIAPPRSYSRLAAQVAAAVVCALGAFVLIGWHLRIPAFVQARPGFIPMVYNTALAFIAGGTGLLAGVRGRWRAAAIAGAATALAGALNLAEYAFGVDLGVDELFMRHFLVDGMQQAGRMAPNTALCFVLIGMALAVAGMPPRGAKRWQAVALLSALAAGLGVVALAGYLFGIPTAYGWGRLTQMAAQTALGMAVLGAGALMFAWQADGAGTRGWLAGVIGILAATATLALWQALRSGRGSAEILAADIMLLFGLSMSFALSRAIRDARHARRAEAELKDYRRHLEDLVKQRTAELDSLLAAVPDLYFRMAEDGTIRDFKAGNLQHLYAKPEDFLGLRMQAVLPAGVGSLFEEAIRAVIGGAPMRTIEYELPMPGGERVYEARLLPSREREVVAVIRDVTERRRAEQALREARDAAEAANRAKSAFLANMSHEIRTPLHVITGMTHLVRRAGVTAEQADWLAKIDAARQRLLDTIDAILDLSKIEAGQFELQTAEFDPADVVAGVVAAAADQARAKGLALVADAVPGRRLVGDAARLRQALRNYLNNAIKFAEAGTVTIRAAIVHEDEDAAVVRYEVEDRGIGIAPEAVPRLFAAFEQADNTTTRRYGGAGLGLATTRRLAQLMGGEAGFAPVAGGGSVFWFTARLAKAATSAPVSADAAESPESVLKRDYADRRILVVDDDPDNRAITHALLSHVWPAVDVAVDGAQAVEMAGGKHYDLILMDVRMSQMDGLEATRRIRALPNGRDVLILAMTASISAADRADCLAAGMNDTLPKAVKPEAPFAEMLKWLSSSRSARERLPVSE